MKAATFGRIGVLAGGPSSERAISLKSGEAVYKALRTEGLDAIFLNCADDIYDIIKKNRIDVAFIALHGRFGEDGTIQKILERERIPYTGSGPEASRSALDKIASKKIFEEHDILVPKYVILEKGKTHLGPVSSLGMPVVVKPQFEGSSIGLSVVRDIEALEGAVGEAFRYGEKVLVEEYIDGRELTVGILEEKALPVIEIVPKNKVYDYTAKYNDPQTKYLVPAPINKDAYDKAQELGRRSHIALGCKSFSRIDMLMDEESDIFVLEANTIPGMTERSLLPKAAEASGVGFGRLCVKLLEDALKRREKTAA